MTTDISRVQGVYKVQNVNGTDILVVDTTGTGYVVPPTASLSKVVITGDLYVLGQRTETSSTFVTFKDPTILLNQGNTFAPKPGGGYVSGLQISRSDDDSELTSAFIQWNENANWNGTGALSVVKGVFEFRVGPSQGAPRYSAIKVNKILIDEASASTVAGAPRLNILGADNKTSVISVAGTTNYAGNVIDDDDIPNKAYVDARVAGLNTTSNHVVDGKSYLTIIDQSINYVPSELVVVLDGEPVETDNIITGNSTGTIAMRVSKTAARFPGIQLVQNQVRPITTNTNLVLATDGTGQIVAASPLLFQTNVPPVPEAGQSGVYADDPGNGGTGMYYVNSSTSGVVTSGEFTSVKKALIYSLIF